MTPDRVSVSAADLLPTIAWRVEVMVRDDPAVDYICDSEHEADSKARNARDWGATVVVTELVAREQLNAPQPDAPVSDAGAAAHGNLVRLLRCVSTEWLDARPMENESIADVLEAYIMDLRNARAPQPNPDHFRAIAIAAFDEWRIGWPPEVPNQTGAHAFATIYDALRTREEAGG